jgi:hypothetical protein
MDMYTATKATHKRPPAYCMLDHLPINFLETSIWLLRTIKGNNDITHIPISEAGWV